ncbi:MAG TPA: ABC transporter transmembrane domain-containing protein, partial [Candidatus Baltobacteraceae bacterium]|nr:ABC transporter transmembrane domain-containing protein [Candidatus Baltobacteraceae bacterium]
MRRLWTYVRPYKVRLTLGLVSGILLAATNALLFVIVKVGVDLIFATRQENGAVNLSLADKLDKVPAPLRGAMHKLVDHLPTKIPASDGLVLIVILSIPIIMFLRSLFNYLNVYMVNWASTRAIADLRTDVFKHLQSLPLSFLSKANTGDLISRVTNDTQSVRSIIGSSLATFISDPV